MKNFLKKLRQKETFNKILLPIILVVILALIGYFSFRAPAKNINLEQAKTKAETFINAFLMQSGNKATIKEITTEYGLYKLKVDIVSDVVESYLTKDGKLFFPQALDIEEITKTRNQTNNTPTIPTDLPKTSKPTVELFVMSYCPYGTQIEKGMLPVLEALGNKIDFELKFCDYIMHDEKEITENLVQYCIQKEQNDKFDDYLQCFLGDGDSIGCLDTTGVNKNKVNSCVSKTDKQYKVSDNYKNKVGWQGSYPGFDVNKTDNEKYGVGGSPTLIINGQQVSSNRDSASLLATICSAFETAPEECQTVLSSASPAPGFGFETTTDSNAAAGCGE